MNAGRVIRGLATCGVIAACAIGGPQLVAQTRNSAPRAQPASEPATFGLGREPTPAEIAAWDIDVQPDGTGLPAGRGTSADGAPVYAARCAACHGKTGKEGPNDVLVGREPRQGFSFARDPRLVKTVGNYWPYATTLFDYIRRAMPPEAPRSLTDDEVYGLVAYLLFLNELIPADASIDASSLPKVTMPAAEHFVPDPRGGPKSGARTQRTRRP